MCHRSSPLRESMCMSSGTTPTPHAPLYPLSAVVDMYRIVHVGGEDVRVNEVVHAEHGHVNVINGIANVTSISAIPATQQKSSTPSTSPKNGMAKCLREVVRMYVSNAGKQNEL
jgi:hypothetical protein